LLIDNYLQKLISPSNFWSKFLKMEKEDSRKAEEILQYPQQLPEFYLVDNLEQFADLMDQISDIYFDIEDIGFVDGLVKDVSYSSVKNYYSQLQKYFNK
jgi:hypothetical protein